MLKSSSSSTTSKLTATTAPGTGTRQVVRRDDSKTASTKSKSGEATRRRRRLPTSFHAVGPSSFSFSSPSFYHPSSCPPRLSLNAFKQFVLFLPLSILLLERIWIPFGITSGREQGGRHSSSLNGYLDVNHVAVSQRSKQHQEISPLSSSLSQSMSMPYYTLERITSFDRISKSTCSLSSPWWTRNTSKKRWVENKFVLPSIGGIYDGGGGDAADNEQSTTTSAIPRQLHMYTVSRCVSSAVKQSIERWIDALSHNSSNSTNNSDTWSIFIHDEKSLTRLLNVESAMGDFPEMRSLLQYCLVGGDYGENGNTEGSARQQQYLREELWKLLVLYVYGGVYVSIGGGSGGGNVEGPPVLQSTVIRTNSLLDDILLSSHGNDKIINGLSSLSGTIVLFENEIDHSPTAVAASASSNTSAMKEFTISPEIVASTPKHPFLYLAIRHLLLGVTFDDFDYTSDDANNKSGGVSTPSIVSQALARAWTDYSSFSESMTKSAAHAVKEEDDDDTVKILQLEDYFVPSNRMKDGKQRARSPGGELLSHLRSGNATTRATKTTTTTMNNDSSGARSSSTRHRNQKGIYGSGRRVSCLQKMARAASQNSFS